ncbi:unnamed protein product [Amoebophrya sp. A120]|nr:unnamed protein product [Amoebophrya sp. A120]|eukprot:GSA120T00019771001.1
MRPTLRATRCLAWLALPALRALCSSLASGPLFFGGPFFAELPASYWRLGVPGWPLWRPSYQWARRPRRRRSSSSSPRLKMRNWTRRMGGRVVKGRKRPTAREIFRTWKLARSGCWPA